MKIHTLLRPLIAALLYGQTMLATAGIEEDVQELMARGHYQTALDLSNAGLKQNVGNRKLLLSKGFSLIKLNRLDEAARFYERLRVVLKNDPEPINNLAMVYRLQQNYAQAITTFSETIQGFPDYTRAYINLGDTYIEIAQNQYQRGFAITGNVVLQQKALLSRNFDQLANRAVASNTQQLERQATPPPPPAVVAKPVIKPAPEPEPEPVVPPQQEVVDMLSSWVNNWMSLEEESYFSHYSQQFIPENNYSLEEWIKRKRNVFSRAGYIKVYLTDVEINFHPDNNNTATVTFKQQYASKIFNASSAKTLVLKNSSDGWLIIKETSVDS